MFDPNNPDELDRQTIAEYVPIVEMFVDKYTRPVGEAQINRMIRSGFDPDKLGDIMLSLRSDGRYAIIDGNHRVQIARKVGITKMFARVFIDKTYEQEADLFVAFNTVNRPSALDRFRARLQMNELQAVEIQGILQQRGLFVAINGAALGSVHAVSALDKIYEEQGPRGLAEIVDILHKAWGTERRAWTTKILEGMRQFWLRYRTEARKDRLIDRLKLTTPERILAEAGVIIVIKASAGTLIGRTIVLRYNQGLKSNRLADWKDKPGKTYSARKDAPEDPADQD